MAQVAPETQGASAPSKDVSTRSNAWTDLALTLPIFLGYHLAVVFLPVRNAADFVTRELQQFAANDLIAYGSLTLALGLVFIGILVLLGRGKELRMGRFLWLAAEGVVYAVAMRLAAGWVVGELKLGPAGGEDRFTGLVMSLGAGFYEEVVFRVALFGLGARLLSLLFFSKSGRAKEAALGLVWAVLAGAVFSGWHHFGELADPFSVRVFVFRWVCGLAFTAIYSWRGFAPAVWTHTVYDIWVLVF